MKSGQRTLLILNIFLPAKPSCYLGEKKASHLGDYLHQLNVLAVSCSIKIYVPPEIICVNKLVGLHWLSRNWFKCAKSIHWWLYMQYVIIIISITSRFNKEGCFIVCSFGFLVLFFFFKYTDTFDSSDTVLTVYFQCMPIALKLYLYSSIINSSNLSLIRKH